ncbi:MAG: tRNA (N(6)-L-threonylcarbamoyladenosine(37)-C(2))-methylthiotransferase MtaB [Clostridia bacterium]|nr:tRNA (N(6)-L-threonylcarbamoyladenosine(37)-C(2))-methylthiotransferase MtaB [Clostridia bacterium]
MAQKFIENEYNVIENNQKADIYVINTCTVTNMSDRKSRQILRRAKTLNENAIIVAIGCYVQVAKEELEKIEEIDLILGTNEKNDIIEIVEQYIEEKKKKVIVTDVMNKKDFEDFGTITYTEKTRAVIKVQDGCDRFCSYCIIPYARGRVRSRKKVSIIKEISQIAKNDIKEVVITGIHVASYGKDFKEEYKLIDLLEDINKIDGIERIRLGSLEPTLINVEFMERLKKLDKFCHHFHLSLQSACDETLKRMNRKYTIEEFIEITKLIRKYYNDAVLTTDIIVGFPGETEEDFNITYENLKKIKFYKMHIFKYSVRNGTKAALMENQVEANIKEKRSKILLKLSDENEKEYNKQYIGKEVEVLFEEKRKEYFEGHTKNYIMIKVKIDKDLSGKIQKVKINKQESLELIGIL